MGQKVNPVGFRLLNNKNWESVWYDKKNYAKIFLEGKIIFAKFLFVKTVLVEKLF